WIGTSVPARPGLVCCAYISLAVDLSSQGPRTTRSAAGLRRLNANGATPVGLLLRPGGRRVHRRGRGCYRMAAKELFDEGYRHPYGSCAACVAPALNFADERNSQSVPD